MYITYFIIQCYTYNLRHCDLVQLHGFLGLIPFGSTLVYDLWELLLSITDPTDKVPVELCKFCELLNKLVVVCWVFNFTSSADCKHK